MIDLILHDLLQIPLLPLLFVIVIGIPLLCILGLYTVIKDYIHDKKTRQLRVKGIKIHGKSQ